MFGLFENKIEKNARKIINDCFSDGQGRPYYVNHIAKPVLKSISDQNRLTHGNAYDVAITFMLVQVDSLLGIGSDEKITRWAEIVVLKCEHLKPLSVHELLIDIFLDKVRSRFTTRSQEYLKYESYEDWYDAFKKACAQYNPALAPTEKGVSLVDFMDDEPVRRAYRDNKNPEEIARSFAEVFDIRTFGQ
jgi:hypothetical protein